MNARKTGRKQNSTKIKRSTCVSTNRNCLWPNTVQSNFPCQFPLFKQTFCRLFGNATAQQKDWDAQHLWDGILTFRRAAISQLGIQSSPNHIHFHVGKLISAVCRLVLLSVSGTGRASLEGMMLVEDVWDRTFYTLPPNSPKQSMSDFSWKDSCLNTSVNWSIVHPKISQGGLQEQNIRCYSLECSPPRSNCD